MRKFIKAVEDNNKQITNEEMGNIDFWVNIHTLNIESDECALDYADVMAKPYINNIKFEGGKAKYFINPNKYYSKNYIICSLGEFEKTMDLILKELYIEKYAFSRVDIAVDSGLSYEKCYKINFFTSELLSAYLKKNDTCKNHHHNIKSSLYCRNRDYTLSIYNKALESNYTSVAKTRFEFRFMRVRKGFTVKMLVNELINILGKLPNYIDRVNENTSRYLLEQYYLEQDINYESRTLNLQEYVSKWAYDFLNWDILNTLYKKVLNGQLKNWLCRYRKKGRNITLYTKTDISKYLNMVCKALRNYRKVTKNAAVGQKMMTNKTLSHIGFMDNQLSDVEARKDIAV